MDFLDDMVRFKIDANTPIKLHVRLKVKQV